MNKSTITVTLYMSELIYDVQNKTYLTGRSRDTGSNHEEVANMQANDDDENLNQVLRSIQNAYALIKTKLSEYIVSNQSTSNNELIDGEVEEIVLTLTVPTNFNHATTDSISSALHQYIVNMSVGDWFTITNKNDAADYVTLATANLEQVRESINKRVRPNRTLTGGSGSRYDTANCSAPVFTPSVGTFSDSVSVTIATSTPDAEIHYTTDGSLPNSSSPTYSSAITISATTTVRAITTKYGMFDSAVTSKTYTKQ